MLVHCCYHTTFILDELNEYMHECKSTGHVEAIMCLSSCNYIDIGVSESRNLMMVTLNKDHIPVFPKARRLAR